MFFSKSYYDNSVIEIGDTVFLECVNTNDKYKYKIIQSCYYEKPIYDIKYVTKSTEIYNRVPISDIDVENGIISSESLIAQILLGNRAGDIVKIPDGEFLIKKIRKHKMYID